MGQCSLEMACVQDGQHTRDVLGQSRLSAGINIHKETEFGEVSGEHVRSEKPDADKFQKH